MPFRTIPLVTGEYYHVFNRGVDRKPIFYSPKDYKHFLKTLSYYRFDPPLSYSAFLKLSKNERTKIFSEFDHSKDCSIIIVCYAFLPNHFHLLLRQVADRGISSYMNRVTNSYVHYFNLQHERVGSLFQGVFKVVLVETDIQLMHLSRYIHLNPLASKVVDKSSLFEYPWTSLACYLEKRPDIVDPEVVLNHFSSSEVYKNFFLSQIEEDKGWKEIEHLILE